MTLRKAKPQEAEILWDIRNQAIRHGCKTSYDADVIAHWTPDLMPEHYRKMVIDYPFFVVEDEKGDIAATGYLDLDTHSLRRYSPYLQHPVKEWRHGSSRHCSTKPAAVELRACCSIRRQTHGRFTISSDLSRWAKSIIIRVWRVLIYAVLKWQSRCNVRNTWLSR